MRRDHGRFEAAGSAIVAVGQGSPDDTARFAADLELPYPVLADPDRVAYRAYGLVTGGLGALAGPAAGRGYLRAVLGGAGGGRMVGDARQLPGAFVVDQTGTLRYAHPATHAADTPSAEELLAVVTGL